MSRDFISKKFNFLSFSDLQDKIYPSIKLDDKLEGIENFHAWKYRIGLILEENYLANFIKGVVLDLEEYEAK